MKNTLITLLIGIVMGIMIGFATTYFLGGHYEFHVVKGTYGNVYLYRVNTLTGKIWWSTPEVHGLWLESQEVPPAIQSNLTPAIPAPETPEVRIPKLRDFTQIAPKETPVNEKPKEIPKGKSPIHKMHK